MQLVMKRENTFIRNGAMNAMLVMARQGSRWKYFIRLLTYQNTSIT